MSFSNRNSLLVAALVSVAAGTAVLAGSAAVKTGDAFPDLSAFHLEGQLPAELAGKVVLVDFWASWCGPCKASFPAMEQLLERYGKDGFVIVAVNLDEKHSAMEEFLKKNPVKFAVVRDAEKKLVAQVNINSMPTSFLLARDGKIAVVHNGFHGEETKRQYAQEIEQLLAAK
jgi:thiol-disulfide isomerase/thioredoxin